MPERVVGELYLGGDGLARGYLNRPDLTSEKFVGNAFVDGERLYRTGDLVRFRPDGNIEFLGRLDGQVKIRGYRIEPGEIEAQLNKHDDVESSLVLVDGNDSTEKRLIAYVVPVEFHSFEPAVVHNYLKTRLPEFMLPAIVNSVPAWPLNQNGKIDRAALSREAAQSNAATATPIPKNQTELHLSKIWENVLGVDRVGITDNFFELGGHSLLAVTMFDAVERLFGKAIPMDSLWFDGGTVETLAQIIDRDQTEVNWPTLIEMQPQGCRRPLFFVHTMGGNLFHYDELVNELGPDQPAYGLQARGVYGREAPRATLEEIAADGVDAMKRLQPSGPYLIVGFSSGGVVAYEMAQQLHRRGEQVSRVILVDAFAAEAGRLHV